MHDTSTFTGNYGEMANQVMGCSAGYEQYLRSRCDAHVQHYLASHQYYRVQRQLEEKRNEKEHQNCQ